MATLARVAAVSVVAVLAVACTGPAAPKAAAPQSRSVRSTTVPTAEAVPMVLETGAPSRLPKVDLHVRSGARDVVLRGVSYTADFSTRRVVAELDARYPVPWPGPSAIGTGDDPSIVIDTGSIPDFVMVKTYARIEPGSLVPGPQTSAFFECNRFSAPRCTITRAGSGLRLGGLGRALFAGDYLVVFCVWHVPPAEQRGPYKPTDAAGSWLFHVSRGAPLGASQP